VASERIENVTRRKSVCGLILARGLEKRMRYSTIEDQSASDGLCLCLCAPLCLCLRAYWCIRLCQTYVITSIIIRGAFFDGESAADPRRRCTCRLPHL
jgi:hypothetical protein